MIEEDTQEKKQTIWDRIPIIFLVASVFTLGFHFQESCLASGRAACIGAILAALACVIAFKRKRKRIALISLLVLIAHGLLVH